MKKERAPDLTPERITCVLEILDGWKSKLSWDLLIDAVEKETGNRYSRFTFAGYPQIAEAFLLRKHTLRDSIHPGRSTPRDERVRAALDQADRAKASAARLEAENNQLLEQFVVWAINAERNGVTMDMLNRPLPKPGRDQSKGQK
jgi:hypothetical protein